MTQILRGFPDLASHYQVVQLSGTLLRLQLDWRERTQAWYATLTTLDGTAILTGVRLEPGADLLRHGDPALFAPTRGPGDLVPKLLCVDAGGSGQPATRSTVDLYFHNVAGAPILARAGTTYSDGTPAAPLWVLLETVTVPIGGYALGYAAAADPGVVAAEAGTITTITVPIAGLSVTNLGRAVPGQIQVLLLQDDLGGEAILAWVPSEEVAAADPATWAASTEYVVGALVLASPATDYTYCCTTPGTSGAIQPVWPTTIGETVEDGSAVWECWALTSDDPVEIVVV